MILGHEKKIFLLYCYTICLFLIIGIEILGFPTMVTAGEEVTAACSYDLNLTSIEWLYNGQAILSSTDPQLNLTFSPVNDTVNYREYVCRVITAYGMLERSITVRVQGKKIHVVIHTQIHVSIVCYTYSLTCIHFCNYLSLFDYIYSSIYHHYNFHHSDRACCGWLQL